MYIIFTLINSVNLISGFLLDPATKVNQRGPVNNRVLHGIRSGIFPCGARGTPLPPSVSLDWGFPVVTAGSSPYVSTSAVTKITASAASFSSLM